MKKLLIFTLALFSFAATAQTKKVTSSDAKFAVISMPDKTIKAVASKDNLYLLQDIYSNNAVIAIDCKSGKMTTLIEGVTGMYEPRPTIHDIATLPDGRLIFTSQNEGIKLFDGKSAESSPLIWKFDAKGSTLKLAVNQTGYILLYTDNRYNVLLNPDFKEIARFSSSIRNWATIDKDANIWLADILDIVKYDSLGKKIAEFNVNKEPFKGKSLTEIVIAPDNTLYIGSERHIYKTPASGQPNIEVARAMANNDANNTFKSLFITRDGEFYTASQDYNNSGIFYYGKDLTSQPTGGPSVSTGIIDKRYTSSSPIKFEANQSLLFGDYDGNIIACSAYFTIIYNPSGIKGYTNIKGKFNLL